MQDSGAACGPGRVAASCATGPRPGPASPAAGFEALSGRCAVPRRDPIGRGPSVPRGSGRGVRAPGRDRAPGFPGLGRLPAHRPRARRDGAHRTRGAARGMSCAAERRLGDAPTARAHAGFAASAFGLEGVAGHLEDCVRAADHGFRSVLSVTSACSTCSGARGPPRAARGHAGQGLRDAAGVEPGHGSALRATRSVDDQPSDRSLDRADRGDPGRGRHPARCLHRSSRQRRRLPPLPRDHRADPRRGPHLPQVRAAQRLDVYPAGTHLEGTTVALTRERVRRARLGMEMLERSGLEFATSELGARGWPCGGGTRVPRRVV